MTYCGEGSLVKMGDHRVAVATLRCKCWHCQDCRPLRKKRLKREARAGNPTRFITLTSRRDGSRSPDEAAQALVRAWKLIRRRIKHAHPSTKMSFMAVFEATKKGWPHLHILYRGPWIAQKLLSQWMDELDGSPVVGIEKIQNNKKAAAYVAKYIGKDPRPFEGCKRYWRSTDYIIKHQHQDDHPAFEGAQWRRSPWSAGYQIARLRSEGFMIVKEGAVVEMSFGSAERGPP